MAYFFERPNEIDDGTTINNSGFKSVLTPRKNEHLNAFERDLYDLERNIEFKRANVIFQYQPNQDINMIIEAPLVFTFADKSNNLYLVRKDTYSKLLQDSIIKLYIKSNVTLINNIDKEAKAIAADIKLNDIIEKLNQHEAFGTVNNLELVNNKIREKKNTYEPMAQHQIRYGIV